MPCAVILTALPVEYLAVRAHLTDLREEMHPQGTIYERGQFGASGEQAWEVGIVEVGAGNVGASLETERAIAYFSPEVVLFVGVAGGIKDVAIGDVVASTKMYGYESGKAEQRFKPRPEIGLSAYSLVQRARAEARKGDWLKRLVVVPEQTPRVIVGPIAAGEKVVASTESDVLRFLREHYGDTIAVEMEGRGFLEATRANQGVTAMVIRGISDLIDDIDDNLIESQAIRNEKASRHASAFAFEILSKKGILTKSIPQSYPVVIEDGTVYIDSQTSNNSMHSFDIQYTLEELEKENYHNLPVPSHKKLFGREQDLKELLYRISPGFYERTVTVTGIGGVGKTSLALEAAYACLAARKERNNSSIPTFDMIVFSSAQLSTLSPEGIININSKARPIKTLEDLCVDIANTLERSRLRVIDPEHQISALQEFLSGSEYRTLIILDNLESLDNADIHEIHEFLKKIRGNHVKTVITTRMSERYDLNLKELSESDSLQMIISLLLEKDYSVDMDFCKTLNQVCAGIPLAIHYSIGILEIEQNAQRVLEKLIDPNGDLSHYCFNKLVNEIEQERPIAYNLFITLSVVSYGLTRETLFDMASINSSQQNEARENLNLLSKCSLVFCEDGYYKMLPLTRRYALVKLEEDSSRENKIRESWVNCYIDIAHDNGGEDYGEWHIKYDIIEREWKNFSEVFLWCQNHQEYEKACILWKHLSRFAYLYGYWSDRLKWSIWLISAASQRGDNGFLAEVKSAYGWLNLLREGDENLKVAENSLREAWNLREHCNPYVCSIILVNLAVFYTRKKDFKRADYWFKKYMEFRKQQRNQTNQFVISEYRLELRSKRRLELRYILYWGERYYREGDYLKAKQLYKQVAKKSEDINWLRFRAKANERLAFIAIHEDELKEAEKLLQVWYPITTRNQDRRRMAFFERDYAYLEFKKKRYEEAKMYANRALDRFKNLHMFTRVQVMNEFIKKCDSCLENLIR
jgi:nucleoside phosphorylase